MIACYYDFMDILCASAPPREPIPGFRTNNERTAERRRPERILAPFPAALVFGPFGEYACA